MNLSQKFKGCIIGGAIGDAWGSCYENLVEQRTDTFYFDSFQPKPLPWQFTDDTFFTLATCDVLISQQHTPENLATAFIAYCKKFRIPGIGASTLKAINDLKAGIHWSQSGRKGEYAAGNGAAMRIAPFSFFEEIKREDLEKYVKITHDNVDAYVGSLAIYYTLKFLTTNSINKKSELIDNLLTNLPDTNVRDRIIQLSGFGNSTIEEYSKLGNNGYVVNSVPFAIFSAMKLFEIGFEDVLEQIIATKGDTDTNASLARQIMGTELGLNNIPDKLKKKIENLEFYPTIGSILIESDRIFYTE